MHEPLDAVAASRQQLVTMRGVARSILDGAAVGPLLIRDARGRQTPLPPEVTRLLVEAVEHLSIGNGIVVVPIQGAAASQRTPVATRTVSPRPTTPLPRAPLPNPHGGTSIPAPSPVITHRQTLPAHNAADPEEAKGAFAALGDLARG